MFSSSCTDVQLIALAVIIASVWFALGCLVTYVLMAWGRPRLYWRRQRMRRESEDD